MLKELKEQVLQANLDLVKYGLVIFTWGNVSGIDSNRELIVIKPSGVPYEELKINDLAVIDMSGNIVEGKMKPSTDTPTHIELYKEFKSVNGIVHTHSQWATSWAQACRPVPSLGTTHADYFHGEVPCTRKLSEDEVKGEYEKNTGRVIINTMKNLDPLAIPGVLVGSHGPFSWGKTPAEAVHNAVVNRGKIN